MQPANAHVAPQFDAFSVSGGRDIELSQRALNFGIKVNLCENACSEAMVEQQMLRHECLRHALKLFKMGNVLKAVVLRVYCSGI